jgi:uncharacterized protein YjbI with pentapeptide repeats
VLAGVGLWFNRQQREQELQTADRRAQDEALQAYLDNMSELLIPNNDQPTLYDTEPPESLRVVAQARTLTVLPRLTGDGKGRVVQFLYESNLIPSVVRDARRGTWVTYKVLDLRGANLRDANLYALSLWRVALDDKVDLQRASLQSSILHDANFAGSTLSGADLTGASLAGADLSSANLRGANLSKADLRRANLWNADLRGANLRWARGWTVEQLGQARSLHGATMPDGRVLHSKRRWHQLTFNEWRKSLRESRGVDGENSGPYP